VWCLAAIAAAVAVGGCATAPSAPPAAPVTDAAAPRAAASSAQPQPGQPRPFAEVIKDAKETAGLFRLWQKDDKVWLEISPEQFDRPYFFSVNLKK
jgi:hypothetical protein